MPGGRAKLRQSLWPSVADPRSAPTGDIRVDAFCAAATASGRCVIVQPVGATSYLPDPGRDSILQPAICCECNAKIEDKTETCPSCGVRQHRTAQRLLPGRIFAFLATLTVCIYVVSILAFLARGLWLLNDTG